MDAPVAQRVSAAFTESLKADRESFNARFAERRFAGSRIDGQEFLDHLATLVDPIILAVADRFPERVRAATQQLFDTSLDLFTASLLGPDARISQVDAVWRCLLPAAADLLARDPGRVAGSLSNAVNNIAAQAETKPDWWIERMIDLSGLCDSVECLLACGKILAWQAGMAQYRAAALETARTLEPGLAVRALNLAADTPSAQIGTALDRLHRDPWLTTEAAACEPNDPKNVTSVRALGAFRGFGGQFLRPPAVSFADGAFWVGDGESVWQFLVDEYGRHLHRCGAGPIPENHASPNIEIHSNGTVVWDALSTRFPHLAAASGWASDGTTLAVTIPTSHYVFLLARR